MDQLSNFAAYSPLAQATRDGQPSLPTSPGSRRQLLLALIAMHSSANSLAVSEVLRLVETGELVVKLPPESLQILREAFQPKARLNPAFVDWLMGLPWWWTNPGVTSCVQGEMALYRSRQLSQLSRLFEDLEQ